VNLVEPHLYTVKDFKHGTVFAGKGKDGLVLTDENLANIKDQFALKLKEKLNELFDSSVPFRQTENTDNCKYCSFKGICQR
jgi:radical SAM protein with 4Fe4S-binding SPASM domain